MKDGYVAATKKPGATKFAKKTNVLSKPIARSQDEPAKPTPAAAPAVVSTPSKPVSAPASNRNSTAVSEATTNSAAAAPTLPQVSLT